MTVISRQLRWSELDGGGNSKKDCELPLSPPPLASTHLPASWFDDGGLHFQRGCCLPFLLASIFLLFGDWNCLKVYHSHCVPVKLENGQS
ncbi:hypothetical protein PIB30_059629 [Stylosanthes scabra]|uniref:Uncharacterized protein n=1 Tax=Stylosanthes scabra TaxID=79078 RepID=A0ABU6UJU2_9FABA|nr:hypothetical protein [Stylosanthes scabra]